MHKLRRSAKPHATRVKSLLNLPLNTLSPDILYHGRAFSGEYVIKERAVR